MPFHVYILRRPGGYLYTGQTRSLKRRLREHGKDAILLYLERFPSRETAIAREVQIKGWSRDKKIALIENRKNDLKRMSRRGPVNPKDNNLAMRIKALGLLIGFFVAGSLWAQPTHEIKVRVGKLDCSPITETQARAALKGASQLLVRRCGLRLRYTGFETIENEKGCLLPANRRKRVRMTQRFSLPFKRGRENEISLFLVDRTRDTRLAWAHYDAKRGLECGGPFDPLEMPYFGSVFLTADTFITSDADEATVINDLKNDPELKKPGYTRASLILAHELVHALTQQGHPSGYPAGNLMADRANDIGEKIHPEQCDCMLKAPWVTKLP